MSNKDYTQPEFPFTDQELLNLTNISHVFGPNELWNKAFRIYNRNNDKLLSTNCMPCYWKVLNYFLKQRFGL